MPLSTMFAAVRASADGRARPFWHAPWRVLWHGAWRITLGLLLLTWSLALLAWLTLHWLILPRLDEWRPQVEAQAARALGHPVQIGRIAVHSSGWVPAFTLHDVVLRDALGRDALRLPRVSAALSVPSMLALRLRFDQLLIEDARLEVRRDARGRWSVGGLDMASAGASVDGSEAADWLFEQHEVLIRGGTLRWVDEQRAAPPLQLSEVQLLLRNRGRRHELRLDATPPADWGDRFSIVGQARGALLSRAGDWQRWKGTLFAQLPRADVSQLRRHVDLPIDLQQGEAALRAWVDWDRGLPQALTLDAALRNVSVRLDPALEPVALTTLTGRFVAERQAGGTRLAIQGLGFTTADGDVWAPSQMALQWQQSAAPVGVAGAVSAAASAAPSAAAASAAPRPVDGGEFSADRLDLALLAELGERLPIGAGLRQLLQQLNPEGTVGALKARWAGPLDAPRSYSARASVKGLAIAAAPSPEPGGIGRPGWRGADLEISASETGGQADLTLADGEVDLPGVFEQAAVPLAQFSAQLQWRIDAAAPAPARPGAPSSAPAPASEAPPRIEVKVLNARFENADARGAFNATWQTGADTGFGKAGRYPGVLALQGTLAEGRALAVARYLPLGIGAHTRSWVQRAVQGGEIRNVAFGVKGDLWDFPFVNRRDGEFRIAGQVQGVTLAPVPSVPAGQAGATEPAWESPWPAFTDVSGELVFERDSMRFQQASGRLWGTELAEVQGRIRALSDHALLEVEGQARGPAADLLRYLRSTPLADWTDHALDAASATGTAELRLGLNIPLARTADSALKASLQLAGNDLRLRPDGLLLAGARGRVDITHKGVQVAGVRAQLLGGEAVIDGGSQADGRLRFAINGIASADALRRAAEPGAAQRLAQRLQGQAAYQLQLGVAGGRADWQLASNLQGLAIDLPEPLKKPADAVMVLRAGSVPESRAGSAPDARAANGGPVRDLWRLALGALKGSALVETTSAGPRLQRSAWSWDAPLPEPVPGGRAVLALPRLDLDAWRSALADASGRATPTVAAAADSPWLPQRVQLNTPELLAGGRRLSGVTLDLQHLVAPGDEVWRVLVQADQTAGTLEYREPASAGAQGRIKARLSRLSLPPAEAQTVADSMAGLLERAPAGVPALDIEIEDFELRGKKLGRLAVEAVNRAGGDAPGARAQVPEWQLNRLQLTNPDARLAATGRWQAVPVATGAADSPRRRMLMEFKLDIDDGGALLQRLGFGRVVRGAKGQMKGTLGWDGSPLDFDLPTLGGRLALALESGQFLKADAGAARLLGVLSLQALPRRLLLDFRDVFQAGFAFDNLTGDVLIANGVAHTENLRLRGLQALVLMAGSADIARETQNLQVVVLPELNTASASLAYAAINPAVGLGAFLGQWLLREPLRQASAREFHITGQWDDPQVQRIERKLLDPLPASAAPDAPATAAPAAAAAAPRNPP